MFQRIDIFMEKIISVHEVFKEARSKYDVELSMNFSAFELFAPNELALSRILAWMLDPRGSHSQGARFLREFLRQMNIQHQQLDTAMVQIEEVVAQGRLDISVKLGDRRKIVIENKPFAPDQPLQLKRYLDHVGEHGHVIYLPGARKEAPNVSILSESRMYNIKSGRLIESSWIDLIPFFERCRDINHSPRVRAFIDEIPRYVRKVFQGVRDVTETEDVASYMAAEADTIETAFLVSNAMDALRERLIQKLQADISDGLPEGWSLEETIVKGSRWSRLCIAYPDLSLRFYTFFDKSNYNDFSYGLQWRMDRRQPSLESVRQVLLRHDLGVGEIVESQDDYPLWRWGDETPGADLPRRWQSDPRPWMLISTGEAARKIIEIARSYEPVAQELDRLPHRQLDESQHTPI
ncbi:PD-(D/E)XK nuclease superfamily protein [Rhizobium sp. RU35A]|uniref:PD-(D/E)XK nuclease family protein n=1 Tax=Rhizobium sp. RU35A TaxID=1907414 RepID=UPI000956D714|nr:PD-(D/E)XK nuclease family protein [Rhizobium sp. RU35A]SIQ70767.1 PD-(D/E)XK nuclease superfamily protein [Rhizobium sp. RU35A]